MVRKRISGCCCAGAPGTTCSVVDSLSSSLKKCTTLRSNDLKQHACEGRESVDEALTVEEISIRELQKVLFLNCSGVPP